MEQKVIYSIIRISVGCYLADRVVFLPIDQLVVHESRILMITR